MRILSITMAMEDGSTVEARRCGLLPDVFATRDGRIIEFSERKTTPNNGHLMVKYRKSTLMARHLVADAWHTGWDTDFNSIGHLDGNKKNVHADNLVFGKETERGRPRSHRIYKELQALELYRVVQDIDAIADTVDLPPSVVAAVVARGSAGC